MGIDSIKHLYIGDPNFGKAFEVCTKMVGKYHNDFYDYLIQNGLLFKGAQLCILECSMRKIIIREKHCGGLGGHFRIDKTLDIVKRSYSWPKLGNDVKKLIETCTIFQQARGVSTNQGLYQPLPIPTRLWESISIDFVMGFPRTK